MEAKRVARAGVMAALLAVSAQVMLPLGPVPFTLQTLVLAMVPAVLDPATSVFTVLAYVVLGAVGLPVFAGFNGGIGALAGPTGGFLWGFVLGCALAGALAKVLDGRIGAYPRALVCAAAL
ncbi:MAG: biotin transporter BioY, partial [Coriobacteriaceae bacterium]